MVGIKRNPFKGTTQTSRAFQLCALDTTGPHKTASLGASHYGWIFIEAHTRFSLVNFTKGKTAEEATLVLQQLDTDILRPCADPEQVISLRTDPGGEYTNDIFQHELLKCRIRKQASAAGGPAPYLSRVLKSQRFGRKLCCSNVGICSSSSGNPIKAVEGPKWSRRGRGRQASRQYPSEDLSAPHPKIQYGSEVAGHGDRMAALGRDATLQAAVVPSSPPSPRRQAKTAGQKMVSLPTLLARSPCSPRPK
jgi:hypothetical protein